MAYLSNTFLRQLLTVLAVMLSRPGMGKLVIRDKHVYVLIKCGEEGRGRHLAFDCTGQERAAHGSRGLRGARGVKNGVKGRQRAPKTAPFVAEMTVVL
jgi:hypothetical protein